MDLVEGGQLGAGDDRGDGTSAVCVDCRAVVLPVTASGREGHPATRRQHGRKSHGGAARCRRDDL